MTSHESGPPRLRDLFLAFGKLGLISFGGPAAHLGYFHAEFVGRRRWFSESEYADTVALCQFLPGPASSQVAFALGLQSRGILGGMIASFCFTAPSCVLMIAFAYGVARAGDLSKSGWLHGLKLAAVPVVAQAVWSMAKNLCPDRTRATLCLATAALLICIPDGRLQILAIAVGAAVGYRIYREEASPAEPEGKARAGNHPLAALALGMFFVLLLALPALAGVMGGRHLAYFDSFYRSGALVFGGGHVVLPLLRQEIVPRGWLSDDLFLAGYGAAQAVPGPLFTFAAYLGAVMQPGPGAWLNGLWCLLAIFLPAWLLIGGALPFWNRLRRKAGAQAALRGANAAVAGILLSALYNPVMQESVRTHRDAAAAIIAFLLLHHWKAPSWLVVLGMGAAGGWLMQTG